MAFYSVRVNLSAAQVPFLTSMEGRTIIVPQYDQNYDRAVVSTVDTDKDKGIPQAFYMHNCMPTGTGYQSIGYDTKIQPFVGATDFDAAYILQNPALVNVLFVPAAGKNYIFDGNVDSWQSISPIAPSTIPDNAIVSTAFVQAQTYIYYESYGCFIYNTDTKAMDLVTLFGLNVPDTKGILSSSGYMLAWGDSEIAWSSLTNPTDFTPSLITGAGGGSVAEAKGKIIFGAPISGGFILYCEHNAVAAKYSGNVRTPFIFSEIPGSGGITSPEQISWQANLGTHYAWTVYGLQSVDKSQANNIVPEFTDFIGARIFEDFDDATKTFIVQELTANLNIKLSVCSGRYLIISYGVSSSDYTHAIILDITLKRFGKLKITHRDCFEFQQPNVYGEIIYGSLTSISYGDLRNTTYGDLLTAINLPVEVKRNIAFLQADGTVKLVNFDLLSGEASGTILHGKFQFQRSRYIEHLQTDVETVKDGNAFTFNILPSMNGKDLLAPVAPMLVTTGQNMRSYKRKLTALNYSYLLQGSFNLTTITTTFAAGGYI